MVLERLSANVSGRLRRRDGAGIQVRARLLHRLGSRDFFLHCRKLPSASVIKSPEEIDAQSSCSSATIVESSRLPDPAVRVSYTKALRSTSDSTEDNVASRVHFQPIVNVVEIPPRDAYTNQQRKSMWRTPDEIRFLVRQNRQEFSHDGRDWRTATEEEDMMDLGDGNLVHPFTYRTLKGKESEEQLEETPRFRTSRCNPKIKVHRKTQSFKRRFVSAS